MHQSYLGCTVHTGNVCHFQHYNCTELPSSSTHITIHLNKFVGFLTVYVSSRKWTNAQSRCFPGIWFHHKQPF